MDKDTSPLIFKQLFKCSYSPVQAMSVAEVKHLGVRGTGDETIDGELKYLLTTGYLPISKMIDFFAKGIDVRIVKKSDVPKIYNNIEQHLQAMERKLYSNVNIDRSKFPYEDMKNLDQFAAKIYPTAHIELQRTYIGNNLFSGQFSSSIFDGLNKFAASINAEEKPQDVLPERINYSNTIEDDQYVFLSRLDSLGNSR